MINWVHERIGTGAWSACPESSEYRKIDVRELVDKPGNTDEVIRGKLEECRQALAGGGRIVICCDYGISRSNSIASGVLALESGEELSQAWKRVAEATGGLPVQLEVLSVVRRAVHFLRTGRHEAPPERSKCLVTGASGYLGRSFLEYVEARGSALAYSPLYRGEADLSKGSAPLDEVVRDRGISRILHFANPRIYNLNTAIGEMCTLLKNVLDVCKLNGTRLVFMSGWEIFNGFPSPGLLVNESVPIRPRSTYGLAKALCEEMIRQFEDIYGLDAVRVRCGPVFGPGCDRPKFIFNFLEKAKRNEPIHVHRYAGGEYPALDMLHATDLCDLLHAVVDSSLTGVVHAGWGNGMKVRDVAAYIQNHVGSTAPIIPVDVDEPVANIFLDSGRAKETFGWVPRIQREEALRQTLEFEMGR